MAEPDPGPASLPGLRPAPVPSPVDAVLDQRRRDLLSRLGQRADSSGTTVLWSGDVPAGDGRPTRVGMVAVPQPAGSVVVAALHGRDDGTAGTCAPGVLPAGPPLDRLAVALPCDLGGPSSRLLVVGPPGDDVLRLLDADGVLLEERPMDDGVAMVAPPGRLATVQVRTADGRILLARTPAPLALGD
ncbi:hypothetical protein KUM42_19840 [Modestobacter sp. L9-4]|uniref:hypothetical protein n=1 Tax=Modestobacter sp. L9-4 TaxID=2851567 RepID=UPI001C79912F|nr:hypothetical protein [Modestobacter sp. L9-4]QXG75983.1 hypothetical protein KUM42_19840 [Modestobacter sp. L9-4]